MSVRKLCLAAACLAALCLAGVGPAGAWGRGTFYVIGTGPAGPATATLQALETMKRVDYLVAPEKHLRLFADYVAGKPVLCDPWAGRWDYQGKPVNQLTKEEKERYEVERFAGRDRNVAKIKELLAQGKDVGLLDFGNPCLFGPSHWYVEQFDPADVVIIPGVGADAMALAALKRSAIPAHHARFVLQAAPFFLTGQGESPDLSIKGGGEAVLADLAKYEHTMVLYMALRDPEKLFAAWAGSSPATTRRPASSGGLPRQAEDRAGHGGRPGRQAGQGGGRYMGLLLIGRFREANPTRRPCALPSAVPAWPNKI